MLIFWDQFGAKTKKSPSQISGRAIKVIRLGFEPKTHSLEGCCSIQLSYRTEPCCFSESLGAAVWEADALVAEPRFRKWVQR